MKDAKNAVVVIGGATCDTRPRFTHSLQEVPSLHDAENNQHEFEHQNQNDGGAACFGASRAATLAPLSTPERPEIDGLGDIEQIERLSVGSKYKGRTLSGGQLNVPASRKKTCTR